MKFADINLLTIGNTIGLVGAVYQGEGQTLLCLFPGEDVQDTTLTNLLMTLEEWKLFLHQTDVHETEVLAKASDGTICKAILRKSQRHIAQDVSWRVFKRDLYKCRYCGNASTPLTVDHVITWEEGGPSIEENLVSSCRKCNKARGNMDYVAWLSSGYYRKISERLSDNGLRRNLDLVPTLTSIPRRLHQVSR